MENNEVSVHEVRVFQAASDGRWRTSKQISDAAKVAHRTARLHCLRLTRLGIFEQAEVFPGHRYRLAPKASKRNDGYLRRLKQAEEVFKENAT